MNVLLANPTPELAADENDWYDKQLEAGIEAYYQTEWTKALTIFDNLKQQYPKDPRPYFFESMMPFLEYFFIDQSEKLADQFLGLSEKAVQLSHQKLEEEPGDTTMVLMLSGLYGYRGLVAAGQNNHRVALQSGLKGFHYTRQLLSLNSNRPDARIGKGMFYYMVGSVPPGLKWATNLVGLKADTEDGFRELKIAAGSNTYISNDAKMILMYLYNKEGNYYKALEYASELTEALPGNVIFLYKKANIHENLGNRTEAMSVYKAIIDKNNPNLAAITEISRKKLEKLEKITSNSR